MTFKRLSDRPFDLLVILGPTASGKTRLGVEAARALSGEIISADSRQVYRGMDIGTGKDLEEYAEIPYHLIDIAEPGDEFNVFRYQRRFFEAFEDIRGRGKLPVMVGGTGMYIEAVLERYDLVPAAQSPALHRELERRGTDELTALLKKLKPDLHNVTDLETRERVVRALEIEIARIARGGREAVKQSGLPESIAAVVARGHSPSGEATGPCSAHQQNDVFPALHPLVFGVRFERAVVRERITARLKERLEHGMIEEVERLHREGVSYERLERFGLEYRFAAQFLKGEINRNDLFQKLNSAIHRFAKRQGTWFRRMERRGTTIHWLDGAGEPLAELLGVVERWSRIDSPAKPENDED